MKFLLGEATKQVLAALTAGIFTPNGVGEYAGKALFYPKSEAKKVVFLNLICNGIQMILTVIFGIFGLMYFNAKYEVITTQNSCDFIWRFCIAFDCFVFTKENKNQRIFD